MNTDDKALERLAREVTTHHPLVLTYEGRVKLTLAALHKAVEPYRKQVEELKETYTKTRNMLEAELRGWSEDDTAVRRLCKRVLPENDVYGDSYSVPGFQGLTEMLVQRCEQLQAENEALKQQLLHMIETQP